MELYVEILEYLKSNGGITKNVDLKPLIKDYLSNQTDKTILFNAMELIHGRKYIITSSNYHDLTTKYAGNYKNPDYIDFKAMLSEKGESYLEEKSQPKIHISNSNNTIIGNQNSQSSNSPSIINESPNAIINKPPKSNTTKKIAIGIFIAIAGSLIVDGIIKLIKIFFK